MKVLLLLVGLMALNSWSLEPRLLTVTTYITNPDRTTSVNEMCADFPSRDQITDSDKQKQRDQYDAQMDQQFTPTGMDLYNTLTSSQDSSPSGMGQQLLADYPDLPTEFGMFVGPFIVFMFLLMMSCMYCCCCCACGCCCCCAKKVAYSRVQLLWPAIVLLATLSLILIVGILGLAQAANIQHTIKASGCTIAIVFDDLLNGNVSSTGQGFFAGIRSISNQLSTLSSNLGAVDTQLADVQTGSATIAAFDSAYTTARNDVDIIPNNSPGGSMPAFNYLGPFTTTGASTNVPSLFPSLLGSTSSSGLIYATYTVLSGSKSAVDGISTAAASVRSGISDGSLATSIGDASDAMDKVASNIQGFDEQFYTLYTSIYPIMSQVTMGTTAFYAALIAISVVAIVATILMAVCSRYKCRYLLYLTCFVMVFIGIVCLLLATMLSTILPFFYWGCDIGLTAFGSKQGFDSTIGPSVPDQASKFLVQCLPGESGNLLGNDFMGSITDQMNNIQDVFDGMNNFSDSDINNLIDTTWGQNYDYIRECASGAQIDFANNTNKAFLENLADPENSYSGCLDPVFLADRWVPTVDTPNAIACELASGANQAINTDCAGAAFAAASGTCHQCMDSQKVLVQVNTDSPGNVNAQLHTRYDPGNTYPDCAAFSDDLTEVYNNFYSIKNTKYPAIVGRANTADASITAYKAQVSAVFTKFQLALSNLSGALDPVIDPDYGLIAGFNCQVFGSDVLLILETACINLFVTTYFLRLSCGIVGIAIFFSMSFTVCVGVRNFGHEKTTSETVDDPNPKNEQTLQNINPDGNEKRYQTAKVTYFA